MGTTWRRDIAGMDPATWMAAARPSSLTGQCWDCGDECTPEQLLTVHRDDGTDDLVCEDCYDRLHPVPDHVDAMDAIEAAKAGIPVKPKP